MSIISNRNTINTLKNAIDKVIDHPDLINYRHVPEKWNFEYGECPERSQFIACNSEIENEFSRLLENVDSLANELLITTEGRCNSPAMQSLGQLGYPVTKGSSDNFGWLSGVINTPKGKIVYG